MEEACDHDVIIEPLLKPTHKIPHISKPEKKKKAKSEQMTSKPSRDSHISMVITESATGDQSYSRVETKTKNHSSKPGRQKQMTPAENVQHDLTVTHEQQNDTLPKIPPLSSFKSYTRKRTTFDDALVDYETFIREGLGRSVEIIHQYDGFYRSRDAANGLHDAHNVDAASVSYVPEESQSHQDLPPAEEVSELSSEQKTSNESSSESEMEVESESSSSVPSKSTLEALPDNKVTLVHNHPKFAESTLPSPRVPPQASRIKQRPCKAQFQNTAHHQGFPQKHQAVSKSSRRSKAPKRRTRETDETEEEEARQDYWSAYRAWAEYYNSYYHHSPYNWMTAFYMNSVYIKEMMKH